MHIHKLVLTRRTCTAKNSIGTKVRLGQRNSLELRILCSQLKTTRIHDSNVHYNVKVSSHWISKLESKATVITLGRIWYGGSYSGGGEQKFPTQTPESQNFPKFHQQLSGLIMHTFGIQGQI
jgi:hypothetical protein